jgi:SAM-dependent methyltransferase
MTSAPGDPVYDIGRTPTDRDSQGEAVALKSDTVWSGRAQAYVESDAHRVGEDLDLLVEWAAGAGTALDVATGGGHVARRLREAGLQVVTCDPAPGMRPDVICRAESLPFADGAFDVVACRTAAHHFEDVALAVREMARASSDRVLIVDTCFMGEDVERAETLRDPSHVRNHTETEWRALLSGADLAIADVRLLEHRIDFAAWLARTGCEEAEAERVEALLGERIADGMLTLDKIAIRAVKGV